MLSEFSARSVSMQVIDHLERRRPTIVASEERVREEIGVALEPIRRGYAETELPRGYFEALEQEVAATLPARWRAAAEPFTRLEARGFGLWRGGDVVARLTYVLVGLVIGGLCVAAPFIPIWEKWFPFALGIAAWWLPDAQVKWLKRRYAKQLGAIVATVETAQPMLDARLSLSELLPPKDSQS